MPTTRTIPLKCAHLFNGIGGFALAAHWMNWDNVMHCEIDPFCNKIMNHHFPNSFQHEDIRTTDFTIWRGKIDLITGGFPCQPYSAAGKRKGKDDDRHLWPQMLRAIREIQPQWIVGENVRGLTNWNGGMVFDEVQADLEAEGYEVLPFLLPACAVNAPHRRDRIWFIAYSANAGIEDMRTGKDEVFKSGITANAISVGLEGRVHNGDGNKKGNGINSGCSIAGRSGKIDWQDFPTQSPVCSGNDGVSMGLADIAVPSKKYGTRALRGKQVYGRWRNESIKALGNAVVPQVVYQIFKAIEQWQLQESKS